MIHLQGSGKSSQQHLHRHFKHPWTCWSCDPAGSADGSAAWAWAWPLVPSPSQKHRLPGSPEQSGVNMRMRNASPPIPKDVLGIVSLSAVGGARYSNVAFTRINPTCPTPWTVGRNLTEVASPWISVGFIAHPLTQKRLADKSEDVTSAH